MIQMNLEFGIRKHLEIKKERNLKTEVQFYLFQNVLRGRVDKHIVFQYLRCVKKKIG